MQIGKNKCIKKNKPQKCFLKKNPDRRKKHFFSSHTKIIKEKYIEKIYLLSANILFY